MSDIIQNPYQKKTSHSENYLYPLDLEFWCHFAPKAVLDDQQFFQCLSVVFQSSKDNGKTWKISRFFGNFVPEHQGVQHTTPDASHTACLVWYVGLIKAQWWTINPSYSIVSRGRVHCCKYIDWKYAWLRIGLVHDFLGAEWQDSRDVSLKWGRLPAAYIYTSPCRLLFLLIYYCLLHGKPKRF